MGFWVQCGSTAEAINNTGELVKVGHRYTVSADLGGGSGIDATVRVYATQNANGTGTKVLLASVHRVGQAGDGYTLFHVVGAPGSPVSQSVDGYYVQVMIGGPYVDHYIAGYYDNIVVTAQPTVVESVCCGDSDHPYPSGDITHDCYVNMEDLKLLSYHWLTGCIGPNWCDYADINHDSDLNLRDIAVFAANWMTCTDPQSPCDYNP